MAGNVQEKQLRWYNIALMSFITVWGFGNVVNNYANQGLVVVFSWVFIFALYFTPYALIVGQLGSTFKDGKGGVSTWIKHTMGPGLAYLTAWTYWVVHIPYLAQKPQAILIALGWAMKGYNMGNTLMVIYAIANTLGQVAALVFSIDAPLKVLLGDADSKYIPASLCRTNASGTPVNGYFLTLVLVAILIMLPTLGIGDMNNLYKWLLNLNSVVMPLRYLWVFVAFIAVVRLAQKYKPEYVFIRNKPLAMTVGIWCFAFTAFACLTGIFPKMEAFTAEWTFQLALNVATPFVLVGLGLIFPLLARKANSK